MSTARQVMFLGVILFTVSAATYGGSVFWKENHPAGPALDYPKTIDLGERDLGETAIGSFRVANHGESTLELSRFQTSCSCAGVEAEQDGEVRRVMKAGIAPGGFIDLSVRVSVGVQPGAQQFVQIVFATNDPAQPSGKIDVVVQRVKGAVFASPNSVIFGAVRSGQRTARIVEVYDNGIGDRRVNSVRSLNPDRFEIRSLSIPDLREQKPHDFAGRLIGRFEVIPRVDRIGPLDGDVELECSGDQRSKVSIPVTGNISSDVACYPSTVVIPRFGGEQFVDFIDVLLVHREGHPFQAFLESVPVGLTATILPTERVGQTVLHVRCEKNSTTPADAIQRSVIRIRTTSMKGPAEDHDVIVVHPRRDS